MSVDDGRSRKFTVSGWFSPIVKISVNCADR